MSRFAGITALCCLVFTLMLPSFAQVPDPVAAAEAPEPGKGHLYIGTGAETVNPADGSLSFDLPLTPAGSRELNFPFGIRFTSGTEQYYLSNKDSGGPQLSWTTWGLLQGTPWASGAWSYDLPVLTAQASVYWQAYIATGCPSGVCQYALNQCYGTNNYVFRGLDGNQHTLQIATVRTGPTNSNPNYCPPITQVSPGDDNHGVLAAMQSNSMAPPVTVTDRTGTVYQFPGASDYNVPNQPFAIGAVATSITDRNGNTITLNSNAYTDTLGRNAISWTGLGNSGDQINVAGLGGAITLQWINTPLSFPETGQNYSGNCTLQSMSPTTQKVLSEIDFPNLQKYKFQYDGTYAKVSKITFPSGGYVRYVWNLNHLAKALGATWTVAPGGSGGGGNYSCNFQYDVPAITDRYVSFDGTNEVLHQQFQYTTTYTSGTVTGRQTTVTSTDLVTNQVTKTKYTYGMATTEGVPITGAAGVVPVETTVLSQDGNGNTLRTVNKVWTRAHTLVGEQTILENGQGTATQRCYNSNEEVTNLYEYGFPSEGSKPADPTCYSSVTKVGALTNTAIGPVRRQTTTVYHPYYQWSYPNPTLPHIVNAPDSVTVANGSGIALKQTLFGYDESSIQSSGANVQLVPPPESARANITTIQSLITGSTYAKSTYTYYDTGQVASMTDPCGNTTCSDVTGTNHTTSYSYADHYASGTGTPPGQTNAYITQVTFPNTGVAHTESFTWGYSDGLIRSHTDQNNPPNSTLFLYNDPGLLGRLSEIDYPDGGKTTVNYNDSIFSATNFTPNYSVTQVISNSPALSKTTTTAFDGMGHKTTVIASDSPGSDYVATTYDGFGRVRLSYNPTRCNPPTTNCGSETTWGFTTTNYDPLNRVSSVVKQDGSSTSTSYSGPCTTATDETGKKRTSCIDGLSLLTGVWEDPNGVNYETDYGYDALGNLLTVNQKGGSTNSANWRTRTFTYDSLSHLLCAANPEVQAVTCPSSPGTYPAGAITYAYDANGNLSTKVAPKPGLTTGTQVTTTSFTYDVLNRITQKSYTNPGSPKALYGYDGSTLSGCAIALPAITSPTDLVGRMSAMCSSLSSSKFSYDSMGRLINDVRNNKAGTTVTKLSAVYTYWLDGSLNTLKYPSGDTLTYSLNSAGRPTQLTDSANNFVTGATYGPHGALTGMTNGTGIITSNIYSVRLQPILLSAGLSGQNPVYSRCYDFHLGVAISNTPCSFGASSTGDNGNVYQIVDNVATDATHQTVFQYDAMNRISQANTATTGTHCWGEVYTIDAWANLTQINGVSGMTGCSTEPLNDGPATGQNHLNGPTYDIAGNILTDPSGSAVTYDAENRVITDAGYTYSYDAQGVRTEKANGSTGTMYWPGPGGGVLAETDLTGIINEEYIYLGSERIARIDRPSGSVHYYFSDHLGSLGVITNSSASTQETCAYYPYGGQVYCTGSDPNHYKFTGKERDTESGSDYFGARYYASNMGRFMTPDWAARPTNVPYAKFGDPQTLNLYTYVENAPVNSADADGHAGPSTCTGWANWSTCIQRQEEEAKKNTEQNNTDAAKNAAQNLSAADVSKIIQQAQKSSSDPATTAINIFNGLGNNVSVTGDVLRQGIKDSKASLDDTSTALLANATSLTKNGSQVTINSKNETTTNISGVDVKVASVVGFTVGTEKGNPTLSHISGLQAKKGIFLDVQKVSVGAYNGGKAVFIQAGKGFIHATVPIPLP